MNTDVTIGEVFCDILDRGKADWIDFAEVMSIVRSQCGLAESAAMALSVELIGDMLNRRLVTVGDLLNRGDEVHFTQWDGTPEQIIERIKKALMGLKYRPGIGDICWLSTI